METKLTNRYDFLLFFDVTDGNPNGDPDAGNLPRIDAETGMGLVTDVCIKRKVRNYVHLVKGAVKPYDIYVKERAILGLSHIEAFKELGYELGEEMKMQIPSEYEEEINRFASDNSDYISVEGVGDEVFLLFYATADKNAIKESLKKSDLTKGAISFINAQLGSLKSRKPKREESDNGRDWMCKNYYDVRAFGAVMTMKSSPSCDKVRGPVQFTFARSIDQICIFNHCITRVAITKIEDKEKKDSDMGRKYTVPYALYKSHGFISAHLAAKTGFGQEDLALFWESLKYMFDNDRSAAHGLMCSRRLIVFRHDSELGSAPAHKLFDLVKVERKDSSTPARGYDDYTITVDKERLPQGVEVIEMI